MLLSFKSSSDFAGLRRAQHILPFVNAFVSALSRMHTRAKLLSTPKARLRVRS